METAVIVRAGRPRPTPDAEGCPRTRAPSHDVRWRMRSLIIKGDFSADEDVTVDFAIEGRIELPRHRLMVAEGADVRATVTAAAVAVHGRFAGHVSAGQVELASTAV